MNLSKTTVYGFSQKINPYKCDIDPYTSEFCYPENDFNLKCRRSL